MSIISEQVKELRYKADIYNTVGSAWELNRAEAKRLQEMLRQAADTIESLSAKLQTANMERSAEDCGGGWIPCKDRLPEDCVDVLVWFEYFRYGEYNRLFQTKGISYMWNGMWSGFVNGESGWRQLRIIAWQPLPEDYHEP